MWCFYFYLLHKNEMQRKVNAKQIEGKKEKVKMETKSIGCIKKFKKTSLLRLFFFMVIVQEILLILMLNEANKEMQIYQV